MIDIHSHILYGVDDGSPDIEESIRMLTDAKAQGITDIILTPHYREGMFPYIKEKVDGHFEKLKDEAAIIGVNIYPGCEYHVDSLMAENIRSGRVHTLADSDFVLAEFSYAASFKAMRDALSALIMSGYTPVVAHVERCECIGSKPELARDLRELGAMLQINADAVIGNDGRGLKRTCACLLKNELADFVGSDAHGMNRRPIHLAEAFRTITKKYSREYAEKLFNDNPGMILQKDR